MDANEYLGLLIFHGIDPDTLDRRDFMLAQVAAPQYVKAKPTQLMPWHKEEQPASPQDVADKVFAMFAMTGIEKQDG